VTGPSVLLRTLIARLRPGDRMYPFTVYWALLCGVVCGEGVGREGKGRDGKGREGKGREGSGSPIPGLV
jgi:hypothetical protein